MKKILLLLCLTLAGCKTRTVVVDTVRTDTLRLQRNTRDSIFLHDSIFVHEWAAGETVYVQRDRWRTRYVEKSVHDTTYIATHDTIAQPYHVIKEVPRQLTWWQKALQRTGILAIALFVGWLLIKMKRL
ncbi:MAG: hypothetical protein IKM57_06400 [Paludibacteraceae bacterium]|nr:hypothetical protein [Paludibacteraceae bacterium]